MKDQIIRARTLVFGAHEAGILEVPSKFDCDVLVIGGGIGGISAALAACELGCRSIVIEPSDQCFPLLGKGSDRLFSATLYDWPHPHFANHAFPFIDGLRHADAKALIKAQAPATLTFPSTPMSGGALRMHLLKDLSAYQSKFDSKLIVHTKTKLMALTDVCTNVPAKKVVTKVLMENGEYRHLESSIVIFAIGFGLDSESNQSKAVGDFYSYANLQDDLETSRISGLVEIVGGGDGGLQEALRFVLQDNYHDFSLAVKLLAANLGEGWSDSVSRIIAAEHQANMALMWGYSEKIIFKELNDIYIEVVHALYENHAHAMISWLDTVLRKDAFEVAIVDPDTFSKKVYPLNRFLTVAIEQSNSQARISGSTVSLTRRTYSSSSSEVLKIQRFGFSGIDPPKGIGTASETDLMRRIAFRAIPMSLDAVR